MLKIIRNGTELLVINDRITHVQKVPLGGVMIKTSFADLEFKDDLYSVFVAAVNAHNKGSTAIVDLERKNIRIIAD